MERIPAGRGGVAVRCRGVIHLYRTFEGHDVVALRGVNLEIPAGSPPTRGASPSDAPALRLGW